MALLGRGLGARPFFYSAECRPEERPPVQGVYETISGKRRIQERPKTRAPTGYCEGLTLTAFLLLSHKSSNVPVRKTANAATPIYTIRRESICLDRISPALYLHLSCDLPYVFVALPAAEITKPLPVNATRKGSIQALYYYQRCQRW
jgi:hypothetical protein